MTIDINQFWNLLTESHLVKVSQTQTLFKQFSSETSIPKSPESLAKWLVEQKAISAYQAKILTAGHSGPFRYGNYTVVEQFDPENSKGQFAGRHTRTDYPVLIQFVEGTQPADLDQWHRIETLVEKLSEIQHPNVAETFEAVAAPDHRFVVSHYPSGTTLADKLPRKARLPWQKACDLIAQAAFGLDRIHQSGLVHHAVSPRTIWLEKNGLVQLRLSPIPDAGFELPDPNEKGSESKFDYLAPEAFDGNQELTSAADLYALGCTLHRVIAGRPVFAEPDLDKKKQLHLKEPPGDLGKYELPDELVSLIHKLLEKKPENRPKSAAEVANLLALLSDKADEISSLSVPGSKLRHVYRQSLIQFLPGTVDAVVAAVPSLETDGGSGAISPSIKSNEGTNELYEDRTAKIQAAAAAAIKRKKNRWKVPAAIAASLLALTGAIALFALNANRTVAEKPEVSGETEQPIKIDQPPPTPNDEKTALVEIAALPPELRPTVLQQLIDDDDQSLWESPTNGPPIQFSYLPVSPKLLFALRPSELVSQEEGQRLLKSLGPAFESWIRQFQNRSGLDLENIQQIIVSLHTNEQFEYEPYFVVRTNQPLEMEQLIQNWNRPAKRELENQQEIFESSDGLTAYYVLHENREPDDSETHEASAGNQISRFAFGSQQLIEEVALNVGANTLSGSLARMADWTDRDRHVNVLFLRNALVNDEGQKLMGLELLSLNREIAVMLPDEMRGGLVSFHLDSGSYFEFMLDKSLDLKAPDLKTMMVDTFRSRREMLMQFVAGIPASPYWDKVRFRYNSMLADFYQNLRWDVEHGEVVANCWLPPMAAHNLLAASELAISFSTGTSTAAPVNSSAPKSLEELLATKRDLNIANPPDLNVLMADLQTEIEDDFGKLPFAFNIRLLGSDLEERGITKNQRPGELVMKQKTLAEILTSIMISANPDKDITGASDPDCQLIWVVAEDPENPGEKAILVTTRVAAAAKSYELPPAFRTE